MPFIYAYIHDAIYSMHAIYNILISRYVHCDKFSRKICDVFAFVWVLLLKIMLFLIVCELKGNLAIFLAPC